ncbi:MAG: hypothetical protein LUQ40_07080 [Methanomicrobiales archaeon]|nr:hypothetical protein [Methanomicrobiales archaeon]
MVWFQIGTWNGTTGFTVKDILLENALRSGLSAITGGKEFSLIMLVPEEHLTLQPVWNLIISAPWLDAIIGGTEETAFTGSIMEVLSDQNKKISRITVLESDDDLVQLINSVFTVVEGGTAEIGDIRIKGVDIRKAIILQSEQGVH